MPYRSKTRRNYSLKRKYPYRKKSSILGKRKMYNSQYRTRTKPTAEVKQNFFSIFNGQALQTAARNPTTFAQPSTGTILNDEWRTFGGADLANPNIAADSTALPCDITSSLFQGSKANERIGNKVKLTRIMGKIIAKPHVALPGTLAIHLILDSAPEASNNFAYTEVFPTPYAAASIGYQSYLGSIPKVYNSNRYRFLKTWVVAPKQTDNTSVDYPISVDIKTNLDVKYRNHNIGEAAGTAQNRLIYLIQYDVVNAWNVQAQMSLLYIDS